MGQHDVEIDRVGWTGRERLTCHTCKDTLVRQPYMTDKEWANLKMQFENRHKKCEWKEDANDSTRAYQPVSQTTTRC